MRDSAGEVTALRKGSEMQFIDHQFVPRPAMPSGIAPFVSRRVDDLAGAMHAVGLIARRRIGIWRAIDRIAVARTRASLLGRQRKPASGSAFTAAPGSAGLATTRLCERAAPRGGSARHPRLARKRQLMMAGSWPSAFARCSELCQRLLHRADASPGARLINSAKEWPRNCTPRPATAGRLSPIRLARLYRRASQRSGVVSRGKRKSRSP